ncbi:MAG TPA: retroviral-like aspartic protease family protein [Burkholderiaceae bacterium]
MSGPALALSLTMLSSPAAADCKLTPIELPVTLIGSRAVATLGINGTQVPLIVDSGAFFSMLTHAVAEQLKLPLEVLPEGMNINGVTGSMEADLTTVKRVQLRNGEIANVDFVVGGNIGSEGSVGLLGRNFLGAGDVEYDLAHGVIKLFFPNDDCGEQNMAYWAEGGKTVSEIVMLEDYKPKSKSKARSSRPPIRGFAELNGKRIEVMFDTGASSTVSLSAARRAGITDMTPAGKIHGVGRGEVDRWTAPVERFAIGSETISNVRLAIGDFDLKNADMLLGIDFFLSHRIYVSKRQRRVYFTYNGGTIFKLDALEMAKSGTTDTASNAASAPVATTSAASGADEPTDAAGFARRGAASAARLDYASALADLNRACQMAPQMADYFARRAAVHEAMRQFSLALKDLDTALQLDPAHAEARVRRATLLAATKNRRSAIEDLRTLDQTLSPQANERLRLAQLYQALDMPEAAIPQWTAWIAAHPNDVLLGRVYNDRCWARTSLNTELKAALDDCDEAVHREGKAGVAYNTRGWLRLRQGDASKALADFDRALELNPNFVWAVYGRGIARRKLGDEAAGQADLAAARKLRPTVDAENARYGFSAEQQALAPTR